MSARWRFVLILCALSALATLASADPDSAREHYRRGAQAYDKGRYKDAVA